MMYRGGKFRYVYIYIYIYIYVCVHVCICLATEKKKKKKKLERIQLHLSVVPCRIADNGPFTTAGPKGSYIVALFFP